MDILFSRDGGLFLLRWAHFLAGITWIGLLYYFNFVQTPFFKGAEPGVRSGMIRGPSQTPFHKRPEYSR